MGFFSWKTADTRDTVWNHYAAAEYGVPLRTVYLLQPNGQAPIEEPRYDGYGRFGPDDLSVYEWLARANLPAAKLEGLEEDDLDSIGITLEMGDYLHDVETGLSHTVFHGIHRVVAEAMGLTIIHHPIRWDEPMTGFDGATPNELVAAGRLVRQSLPSPANPIKLSFDPHARYEDLPASPSCPTQGFFVGAEDDGSDEDEEDYDDGIDDSADEDPDDLDMAA